MARQSRQPARGARSAVGRGRHPERHRPRRHDPRAYAAGARVRLQRFRRGSSLVVAITALLLLLWGVSETQGQPQDAPQTQESPQTQPDPQEPPPDPLTAVQEATDTIRQLVRDAYAILPKVLVAVALAVLAAVVARAFRWVLRHTLRGWSRADATGAMVTVGIWALALAAALSVIAGDARAMVGLVGLTGLALSWALQAPIESFTAWTLNAFKGYYRVGDRISVGDVFGDVYRIDVLTTTVWEAGGPEHPVAGAQPTGSLITFPNSEVLRSNIVNYTRLFPYVWDEITLGVGEGTDMAYAVEVCRRVAGEIVLQRMEEPIQQYNRLLEEARLAFDIPQEPQVFITLGETWNNLTIRYLVNARQRRRRSSEMSLAISQEVAKPEHAGKIMPYVRARIRIQPHSHSGP